MININASIHPHNRIHEVRIGKTIVGNGDKKECVALKHELNRSRKKLRLVKSLFKEWYKWLAKITLLILKMSIKHFQNVQYVDIIYVTDQTVIERLRSDTNMESEIINSIVCPGCFSDLCRYCKKECNIKSREWYKWIKKTKKNL